MTKLTVMTCDAHAGAPTVQYRDYLPAQFHSELDDYLKERASARAAGKAGLTSNGRVFAGTLRHSFVEAFLAEEEVVPGGPVGAWDFDVRRKELEGDGVVAEVIFAGPANLDVEATIPFQGPAFFGDHYTADRGFEAMWAGARAYNRWLAERFDPSRQVALALIPSVKDLQQVTSELKWAASRGFRGFLLWPAEAGIPRLYDDRYDVIWSLASDLGLILHFHGAVGQDLHPPSTSAAATVCFTLETPFSSYRPLWYLTFGGVFERYPDLQVVFTEQFIGWVPGLIDTMDVRYEDNWTIFQDLLPRRPSEYWYRQCHLGASFISRPELSLLDAVGPGHVMFGNDYPHVEGTWPRTKTQYLHEVFAGAARDTIEAVCGGNAMTLYGMDTARLGAIAEAVGPDLEAIIAGKPSPAESYKVDRTASRAGRPVSYVMGAPSRTVSAGPGAA